MTTENTKIKGTWEHSIRIDEEKCVGCVSCVKACPTKAIRLRREKAVIQTELCIACGECVRACPHEALIPQTSSRSDMSRFKYKVALPSLTLYAQFGRDVSPGHVLKGLEQLGFDATYDISWMCEMIASATDAHLSEGRGPWPKISVTCPAIIHLIQLRYPDLLPHLIPIETGRELSAKLLRRKLKEERNLKPQDIGIFFITPCLAIMKSIVSPVGLPQSYLDGALSIAEIYSPLREALEKIEGNQARSDVSPRGLLWAMAGGEISGMRNRNTMTVRGLKDIQFVFDRIESRAFQSIDFIEAYICPDGCINGPLVIEGRYIAQRTIQHLAHQYGLTKMVKEEKVRALLQEHFFDFESEIGARKIRPLGYNVETAISLKKKQEDIWAMLPRKDCAACGAPDCATFAQDVVEGQAKRDDCVFVELARLRKEKS